MHRSLLHRTSFVVLALALAPTGWLLGQNRNPRGGGLSQPAAGGAPPVPASIAGAKAAPLNVTFDETPLDRSNAHRITSFSDVLEKVMPAVVSVYPVQKIQVPVNATDEQIAQLLQRMFGGGRGRGAGQPPVINGPTEEKSVPIGVGSGSIITADGYVITNHHVVTGIRGRAPAGIRVKLADGREFEAKLVGSDENTDLALLKVEARNLPFIKLADSNKLKVGDIVFAVGNPMDVGFTVTQGIVSATQRTDLALLGGEGFENFIQTDASINPGNSGGPLVDAEGRQVGLSSAILSTARSGGNIGIGFAIPSTLARDIIKSLAERGVIRRGLLGVMPSDIDYEMAQKLGLASTKGALLDNVSADQPGARAGLKQGDVVIQVDDEEVDSASELRFLVASRQPGAKVNMKVLRAGETRTIAVTLGDRGDLAAANAEPDPGSARPLIPQLEPPALGGTTPVAPGPSPVPPPSRRVPAAPVANAESMLGGVTLEPITPALRRQYKLPDEAAGLVVTGVASTSPSAEQFVPGMVLLEINKKPVVNLDEVRAQLKPGAVNIVRVLRDGHSAFLSVIPPAAK